jgi:hypothetical protein
VPEAGKQGVAFGDLIAVDGLKEELPQVVCLLDRPLIIGLFSGHAKGRGAQVEVDDLGLNAGKSLGDDVRYPIDGPEP